MLVIGALLLAQTAFAQLPLPANVPTNNLKAYYTFSGNGLNAVDTNLHLATVSSATPSVDRFGSPASAYFLDGIDDFITLPPSVMSGVNGSFTISIWHFIDSLFVNNPLGYELISDRNRSEWFYSFRIGYGYTTSGPRSQDSTYFDRIVNSIFVPQTTGPNPVPDGWTHFAFVLDQADSVRMKAYVNGVPYGSRINSGQVNGGRQVNIGRALYPNSPVGGAAFVRGIVDEVGIWTRALSDAEIFNLYNACGLILTSHPRDTLTTVGSTVQFNVGTTASVGNYFWQIDSTGNGFYQSLQNGGMFSGVNTPTLTVSAVGLASNGWLFRCTVADSVCTVNTFDARLQVICGPNQLQGPLSQTLREGDTAVFMVTASTTGSAYLWQADAGSGFQNLSNFGQYSGVNTHTLRISHLNLSNNQMTFRCLVSSAGCSDTSTLATLTVRCLGLVAAQPRDTSVLVNQPAAFSTLINRVGNATYQWLTNTGFQFQPVQNGFLFSGATTSTLTIASAVVGLHNTAYKCVVQIDGCSDTTVAVLLEVRTNIGIAAVQALPEVRIFPNPSADQLFIDLSDWDVPANVEIYDVIGKKVFAAQLEPGLHPLRVADWPHGLYILQLGRKAYKFQVAKLN